MDQFRTFDIIILTGLITTMGILFTGISICLFFSLTSSIKDLHNEVTNIHKKYVQDSASKST